MTDEELFKAWKSEQYKDQSTEERLEFVEHLHTFPKYFEKTFLAGLKAKTQWHDLRKNPTDLPEKYIPVLNQYGEHRSYDGHYWRDCDDVIYTDVIAWCEIPTFDKE